MIIVAVILLAATDILAVWYGYWCWFRPKEYFDMVDRHRSRAARLLPFVPKIWTVRAVIERPALNLWAARLISLLVAFAAAVGLLTVILT